MDTTDRQLAYFALRIAKLEQELAETRRANAAWRALYVRSEMVLGRVTKQLEELQGASAGHDLGLGSGVDVAPVWLGAAEQHN